MDFLSKYKREALVGLVVNVHNVTPGGITLVYEAGTEFFSVETIEDIVAIDYKKGEIAILLYGKRLDNFADEREVFIWTHEAKSRKVISFNLKNPKHLQRVISLFLWAIWKQKELLRQMKIEIRVV